MAITATWPETWTWSPTIFMSSPGLSWFRGMRRCGVGHVFLEAAPGVVRSGSVDFPVRIHAADGGGQFFGVGSLEQQPIEPDAGVALRVLLDEVGEVLGQGHLPEPLGGVERAGDQSSAISLASRSCLRRSRSDLLPSRISWSTAV